MKHPKFSLQINEPCSQNWEEMSPQEQGRFCSSCTKIVIDFTAMTENQIIAFFKNHPGEVCGRIQNHQLERNYALSVPKTPWYVNYFLQFALSGLLTLKVADSSAGDTAPKTEQLNIQTKEGNKFSLSIKEELKPRVEGKVILVNGASDLQNTTVRIKETGQSFQTDSTGRFGFDLPEDFKGKQLTITFSHARYESVHRIISVKQLPLKNLVIRMYHHSTIKMGKMMYRED